MIGHVQPRLEVVIGHGQPRPEVVTGHVQPRPEVVTKHGQPSLDLCGKSHKGVRTDETQHPLLLSCKSVSL